MKTLGAIIRMCYGIGLLLCIVALFFRKGMCFANWQSIYFWQFRFLIGIKNTSLKKKSEYETEIQYNNKYLCPSSSGKCGYRPNHPCPFLKATTREEKFFGDNLFRDWRYNPDGSLNKDFVLNNPIYGGEILVTGKILVRDPAVNMLHGQLRDMAFVWSFLASLLISIRITSWITLFAGSGKWRVLKELFDSIYADPKTEVEVNLPEQTITNKATGKSESFEINGYKKHCLMNGLDDIDFLLTNKDKIEAWENASR